MDVVKFLLPHLCAGGIGGAVAAVGLIATSGPLRALTLHDPGGWLGLALLVFGFVLIFAPAAAGLAIMSTAGDDDT